VRCPAAQEAVVVVHDAEALASADDREEKSRRMIRSQLSRFPGLVVLVATHRGRDFSPARLGDGLTVDFAVRFSPPDKPLRARLWAALCPPEMPRGTDVDFEALAARYNFGGGARAWRTPRSPPPLVPPHRRDGPTARNGTHSARARQPLSAGRW
jgi:hypothetical protein